MVNPQEKAWQVHLNFFFFFFYCLAIYLNAIFLNPFFSSRHNKLLLLLYLKRKERTIQTEKNRGNIIKNQTGWTSGLSNPLYSETPRALNRLYHMCEPNSDQFQHKKVPTAWRESVSFWVNLSKLLNFSELQLPL